jgi:hypothetical protein
MDNISIVGENDAVEANRMDHIRKMDNEASISPI